MWKRGVKPKGKVALKWSPSFAYAIGLIVTDGNLSPDGRHIVFVSKDSEQLNNFCLALGIGCRVSHTTSGFTGNKIGRVQFSDSNFHNFLITIGISPNKTKTIRGIEIPEKYFCDFLRGHLDGDGCVYSYYDPRWKNSFMCYTSFLSASKAHIDWLRKSIHRHFGVLGHLTKQTGKSVYQLRYAKKDSKSLWKNMYYKNALCLTRKRLKIERILRIIAEQEIH